MPLPEKLFYGLQELADRWSLPVSDLGSYAVEGTLTLSIILNRPVRLSGRRKPAPVVSGLVPIVGLDAWPAFSGQTVTLNRVATADGKGDLPFAVDDPGIPVSLTDLMISRPEKRRFETMNGLSPCAGVAIPDRRSKIGAPVQHDWDRFWAALCHRIHEEGIPLSKRALTKEMHEWFARHSTDIPDERTIRRKVQLLYGEFDHRSSPAPPFSK